MATQISLNDGAIASAGALAIQTNGTTQAVSISTGQVATVAQNPILTSGTANGVAYLNGSKVLTTGSALVFDGSSLGVGVTPSAWTTVTGLQVKNASIYGFGNEGGLYANAYYASGAWRYIATAAATGYDSNGSAGQHRWYNAASGTAGNAISFTQAMTLNANGVLALQGASTSATGVGITFPATQSASTDANTLDDYEEGTFTPTLTLTTPGTFSTLAAVGVYTKVGNLVTATGRISFTKGTGSGDLVLGGLPFTSINTATYQNAGALSTDTFGVTGKIYQIILGNNTTVPNLNSVTQAGGAAAAAGVSDFGAAQAAIRYTFSYHV